MCAQGSFALFHSEFLFCTYTSCFHKLPAFNGAVHFKSLSSQHHDILSDGWKEDLMSVLMNKQHVVDYISSGPWIRWCFINRPEIVLYLDYRICIFFYKCIAKLYNLFSGINSLLLDVSLLKADDLFDWMTGACKRLPHGPIIVIRCQWLPELELPYSLTGRHVWLVLFQNEEIISSVIQRVMYSI